MILSDKQKKVIESIVTENKTVDDISINTGLEPRIVKNILMEFIDADLIKKSEDGIITLRENFRKPKNGFSSESLWKLDEEIIKIREGKLTNLSRKV